MELDGDVRELQRRLPRQPAPPHDPGLLPEPATTTSLPCCTATKVSRSVVTIHGRPSPFGEMMGSLALTPDRRHANATPGLSRERPRRPSLDFRAKTLRSLRTRTPTPRHPHHPTSRSPAGDASFPKSRRRTCESAGCTDSIRLAARDYVPDCSQLNPGGVHPPSRARRRILSTTHSREGITSGRTVDRKTAGINDRRLDPEGIDRPPESRVWPLA